MLWTVSHSSTYFATLEIINFHLEKLTNKQTNKKKKKN